MGRVTIRDIAAAAQVSPSLVSAVLNRNRAIRYSKAREKQILDLVRTMGYRPNRAAQVLGKGRSRQIGVLSYSPADPSIARLIGELEKQISRRGYSAIYGFWSDFASIRGAFDSVLAHPLDGLICMHDGLSELIPPGLSTVFYSRVPGRCCVTLDYEQYFDLTLSYLASLGLESAGFFGWHAGELYDLFLKKAARRRITPVPNWSPKGSGFYDDAFGLAMDLFAREKHPDALLCRNDVVAFAVINAALKSQVRVPEDLSVTGFDDIAPAACFIPPLTTCGAPAERIAAALLERLFGGAQPGSYKIDMDLKIRATCMPSQRLSAVST
ncbi:MAG: LacI family DNA-binding transcriptional regulator [Lentisphaeria bacterium]|nr:LacI family DNA-binding transcriptional regulator [Lentisphaeria bacterium]